METLGPITAYYDALCPMCRAEMHNYKRRGGAFLRLQDCNGDLPADIDREAALAALHVRLPDGQVVTGIDAFIAIWERLDGWRGMARLMRPLWIRRPVDRLYRWLAPYRPRRRCTAETCQL